MTTRRFGWTVALTSVLATSVLALPAAAAAQSAACNLAQASATAAIDVSMKRLEDARLTNRPASLREATLAVQASLVYIRALLAPCAEVQAAGEEGHAGHVMPAATAPSTVSIPAEPASAVAAGATPAAADAHAGHVMPAAAPPASALPQTAATKPEAASEAAPNVAAPAAVDAHAGHVMPAAPAAVDAHAGHVMPAAPAAAARPPTPAAARASAPAAAGPPPAAAAPPRPAPVALPGGRTPAVSAEALTCAANVDRRSAPRVMYQGRMYYFCTEQERLAFAKEPAKYVR